MVAVPLNHRRAAHSPARIAGLAAVGAAHLGLALYVLSQPSLLTFTPVKPPVMEVTTRTETVKELPPPPPVTETVTTQVTNRIPTVTTTINIETPPASANRPVATAPADTVTGPTPVAGVPAKRAIVPGRIDPKTWTAPEYPSQSVRLEEEGRVVLRLFCDVSGRITVAEIAEGSGKPRLDNAALTQARRGGWTCQPGTVDGKPDGTWFDLSYRFKLEGGR
ncbi:energy transducer TonB [Aerophototrophica crusticola]|uniref:Energy transducer TonB n=1 Tax=Aerophototrophica crusticola TaxID=1709002 RepID=A0A858R4V6_9PROT|nr:energy transducer TonB [Rhodospirillaceae bacterium B3]